MKMIKNSALLLAVIITVFSFCFNVEKTKAEANVWENVGTAGFSSTSIDYISSAFNPETDELYVAYVDSPTTLSVKRFNGTSWVNVGSGFASYGVSGGPQDHISLAFNPSTNEPYVAFRDFANSNKATVKRFNGTSWVDVGTPGFSGAGAYYISLAFYYPTN